jgi:hypothetical protein
MGTISISIPLKVSGSFKIKDPKFAKKLVEELEQLGERISPFDDVFGIWAGRAETEKELTEKLRNQSNRRNG